jgi:hypothetical protein
MHKAIFTIENTARGASQYRREGFLIKYADGTQGVVQAHSIVTQKNRFSTKQLVTASSDRPFIVYIHGWHDDYINAHNINKTIKSREC